MLTILVGILVFVLGAVFGSFYNMLIYRLTRDLPIVRGRSFCPHCEHSLYAKDLVPIFSYLVKWGRCSYCGWKIPKRYLWVEILSGTLMLGLWVQFGVSVLFIKYFVFFSGMIILFFTDFEAQLIPDCVSYGLIFIGLGFALLEHRMMDSVWGIVIGFGVYFLISVLAYFYYKQEALGGGDVKLGAAVGAFWGVKIAILSIYLSFMIGGVIAIILVLTHRKKKTDVIPFGPIIILANIVSLVFLDLIWGFFFL